MSFSANPGSRINTRTTTGYWRDRLQIQSEQSLYHQYEQLEKTGCLANFYIAAGLKEGFREGFFFADSDAYKWLEAACLSLADTPDPRLANLVDEFISVLESAQSADGYLYTYNQIHFPSSRWQNLQVEHELYCMGHLIEAGVTHYQTTGSDHLLRLVCKTADLIVTTFMNASDSQTDGHEEIEIALLRLAQMTGNMQYQEMAKRFIARRGKVTGYGWKMAVQLTRTGLRMRKVDITRKEYYSSHPDQERIKLPGRNAYHLPRWIGLRLVGSLLSGRFTQNEKPVVEQAEPVGHAVRFVYLQTARAMLARMGSDPDSLEQQVKLWQNMVEKRMYANGGLGALPLIEGFGKDYELPDVGGYGETCAALGSIYWNHEMGELTGEACYPDLLEWQLYNAAGVGESQDGCSYLYNNPLTNPGEIQRQSWYDCPCCPSNLSRTWFRLKDYIWSKGPGWIRLNQFISSQVEFDLGQPVQLELESGLPWDGESRIRFQMTHPHEIRLILRFPSWAKRCVVRVNGTPVYDLVKDEKKENVTGSGYDPREGKWITIEDVWQDGDVVTISFPLEVKLYRQDRRIPGCGGMVAIGRGPILYCLEQPLSNPFELYPEIDLQSIKDGEGNTLKVKTTGGEDLTLIPYFMWGNSGPSMMSVFFRCK